MARPQLGTVVGYHLVIIGETDDHYCPDFDSLGKQLDRFKDRHLDLFVLIKTDFGELKLQKMRMENAPKIGAKLLSESRHESFWRPASEIEVANHAHYYSEN